MIIHRDNGEIIVIPEEGFDTLGERRKGHAAMLGGAVKRDMVLENQPMTSVTETPIEVISAHECIGNLALAGTGLEA